MKGLLLKDWYMVKKYCRAYLLLTVVFMAVSFVNNENMFFCFYPCLICGMLPVHLLSYDERSRWLEYSRTLPYTKAQIVSSKYLIGLFMQLATLIATGVIQAVRMNMDGTFQFADYIVLMLLTLCVATVSSSICLPFIFKHGTEKGRIAYYVMVGIVCAMSVMSASLFRADLQQEIQIDGILPILVLVGIGIYALSWYLSIVFFKKREI